VAAACDDSSSQFEVTVFEVSSGNLVCQFAEKHEGREKRKNEGGIITAIAFAHDGRTLATTSHTLSGSTLVGKVRLWELATGKERRQWQAPSYHHDALAFSPNSRMLVTAGDDTSLWDVATGKELCRLRGHQGAIAAVAFAPDGKLIATASNDTTVLLWDISKYVQAPMPAAPLTAGELQALWSDLASPDAGKAYAALAALESRPDQAVSLLRLQLPPIAVKADAQKTTRLIADLDNSEFAVRQKAAQELQKLGELAEPELRKALADKPPLEVQQRIQQLLERVTGVRTAERLQEYRAIEVLERIGTAAARQALKSLAEGTPGPLRTREAQEALRRLQQSDR
jgi:hypothetical protein